MVEFSKDKWKFMTFGLLGVILLGAIIPQANAATDISQVVQKIYDIVKDIQTKTNGAQSTLTNLDVKVSTRANQTSVDSINSAIRNLNGSIQNTLVMKRFSFGGEFLEDKDSFLGASLNCDQPYTVQTVRVSTSASSDDSFKVYQVDVNDGVFHFYIHPGDGPEDDGNGFNQDIIQFIGQPITASQGTTRFIVKQTERDGNADILHGIMVYTTGQDAQCTASTIGPNAAS